MLLQLPTFNAALNPCPVNPATAFTAHANGHFCGSCQRVVQDFSQSRNPVADLAAARAASPDGRVCGSFQPAQVQVPTLTQRLRWFIMALVLVVGQGLTAREALAQVQRPVLHKAAPHRKHVPVAKKQRVEQPVEIAETLSVIGELPLPEFSEYPESELPVNTGNDVYTYAEQMPQLPSGGGIAAIVAAIQQQVRWPTALRDDIEGRVYASFIVGKDGIVRDAKVVKGLHPLLDAEALRAIQALPTLVAGRQNGQPVAVAMTVPVTFRRQ